MRVLLLALILSAPMAQARLLFVHRGRVALGPRFGVRHATRTSDLAFSALKPGSPKIARQLRGLSADGTYRCDLKGQFILVGVSAHTGAMLSRFRVDRLMACRPTPIRAMVLASRGGAV